MRSGLRTRRGTIGEHRTRHLQLRRIRIKELRIDPEKSCLTFSKNEYLDSTLEVHLAPYLCTAYREFQNFHDLQPLLRRNRIRRLTKYCVAQSFVVAQIISWNVWNRRRSHRSLVLYKKHAFERILSPALRAGIFACFE